MPFLERANAIIKKNDQIIRQYDEISRRGRQLASLDLQLGLSSGGAGGLGDRRIIAKLDLLLESQARLVSSFQRANAPILSTHQFS